MRALQRAIVGVGLALVTVVAMALLIGDPGSMGPDPSSQPATQATGPRIPLVDVPAGPPEPVDAAEDASVGTLPPPPDASLATQLASRDLLTSSDSAEPRSKADGKALGPRKARAAKTAKAKTPGRLPAAPKQDFSVAENGWTWGQWEGANARDDDRYDDRDRGDRDGCRRGDRYGPDHHRYHRDECQRRDRHDRRDRD